MDPKQNNNNNLNIEGVVHTPWRHAAGAVQGATPASFLTPFRHSLLQRSSAICSAVGGVARSAATPVALRQFGGCGSAISRLSL